MTIAPLPPVLRDVQFSGRFDAGEANLEAALDLLARHNDRIRMTEVAGLRAALRAWAKKNHWHLYHPKGKGPAECAILSRYPFALLGRAAFQATKMRLRFGRTAPTYVVARRTKHWGWADVLHTPAHNEGLKPGRWQTKVYLNIVEYLHTSRLNRAKRRVASGDYNIDTKRAAMAAVLARAYPGMDLLTEQDQAPTEGGRVIDTFLVKGLKPVGHIQTLGSMKRFGFDHRPVRAVFVHLGVPLGHGN